MFCRHHKVETCPYCDLKSFKNCLVFWSETFGIKEFDILESNNLKKLIEESVILKYLTNAGQIYSNYEKRRGELLNKFRFVPECEICKLQLLGCDAEKLLILKCEEPCLALMHDSCFINSKIKNCLQCNKTIIRKE